MDIRTVLLLALVVGAAGCTSPLNPTSFLVQPGEVPDGLELVPYPGESDEDARSHWQWSDANGNPSDDSDATSAPGLEAKWTQYFRITESKWRVLTVSSYLFESQASAGNWIVVELDERDVDDCDGMHFVQFSEVVVTIVGRGTYQSLGTDEESKQSTEQWDQFNDALAAIVAEKSGAVVWC